MSEQMIPSAPPTRPGVNRDAPSSSGGDERVSTLVADRACTQCAFNLAGQPILRERHYRLLIIRCPECGTVASLQEYPLLGRWANRWGAVAAAVWFLVMTGISVAAGGIIMGFTLGTLETSVVKLSKAINELNREHEISKGTQPQNISDRWIEDVTWWETVNQSEVFRQAGGWVHGVNWQALLVWIVAFLVLFPLAGAWGVAMSHRRGVRLVVTVLPMLFFATVFFAFIRMDPWVSMGTSELAIDMIWPVVAPISLILAGLCLTAGVLCGRPIARLLIVLMLPPRLRVPLSFLWICDGKPPPKPI